MSFTYDPSTDAGKVRLLISDTQNVNHIFEDTEIQGFLEISSDVRLAAAMAIECIAVSEVLLLKVITTQNLSTHGEKMGRVLKELAESLRARVDQDYAFDYAEMVTNSSGYVDRVYKQFLRGAI